MIFDGHNDVLLETTVEGFLGGRGEGHLDLPRARAGGLGGGIFAIFTPTPGDEPDAIPRAGGGYDTPPADPVPQPAAAAHAAEAAALLRALEDAGALRVVRTVAELDACAEDGMLAAVLHLEGAEAIDPGLEALDRWHAGGLRSLGITWSRPNAFGHGVPFAFPSSPDTGPGLTEAGRALVDRCNDLGVLVDLSHLNEAGFWDVARRSRAPLVASHSGVHALCPSSRNLTGAQLDAIAASGGLVGVVFAVHFLRADGEEDADTPAATIAAHVRHVADRVGVDHVALGSDFDGATVPDAIGDAAGLPRLIDALRNDGFDAGEIERIAWGNWRRVLAVTWG
jgi:membrane dipeptidase